MRGWRGSPARHALAAKGVSTRNGERPAALAAVPMRARPQGGSVSLGEVFDQITESAFSEANGSRAAEELLADRAWLKSRIHQEAVRLQFTVVETCQLENDLLPLFGEEPAVLPGIVQVLNKIAPKPPPPVVGAQP